VRELQVRLIDLSKKSNRPNWHPGNPDGQLGSKTETAIKAFQKDQNLIADGQVGSLTVEALYKDYAQLRDFLGARQWQQADEETASCSKTLGDNLRVPSSQEKSSEFPVPTSMP